MEKPLLVELKGQDQIDKILSSLQKIVDSGTSVVFSFSTSGRVTVLLSSPPSRARSKALMEQDCPVERGTAMRPRREEAIPKEKATPPMGVMAPNSYVRSDSCSPEET